MVIAKHIFTGNYKRVKVIDDLSESVLNLILGNKIISSLYSPVDICASIKFLCNDVTIALYPFIRVGHFKFLNIIMCAPTFNFNLCKGIFV